MFIDDRDAHWKEIQALHKMGLKPKRIAEVLKMLNICDYSYQRIAHVIQNDHVMDYEETIKLGLTTNMMVYLMKKIYTASKAAGVA